MSGHAFEHPDRRRMIDRSRIYETSGRRSPVPYEKLETQSRRFESQNHRNGRKKSPLRNGNGRNREHGSQLREDKRNRSRSPYQIGYRSDSRDRARSRSPKRLRRRSPSSSPDPRRRDSPSEEKRIRRRSSSARSPRRHRNHHHNVSRRTREAPRPTHPSSPDSYKRSKRRYSRSPSPRNHRHRSRDRIHQSKHQGKQALSLSPAPPTRSKAPLPSQQDAFSGDTTVIKPDDPPPMEKQKPNYAPTGALARETNTVAGTSTVLKYNEPAEARLPPASAAWRMYVFKGDQELEKLDLHRRSCWLFGRERAVVDVPIEHPSCSKQHAVVQFRFTEKKGEFGDRKGGVKPYVIDLESANGTMLNGAKVDGRRYMELRTGDVLKFGESTRDYVLLLPPKL